MVLTSSAAGATAADGGWPITGMLNALGYHVGNTRGVDAASRKKILTYLFKERMPLVFA